MQTLKKQLLLCILSLLSLSALAETEFKIIELQHRFAEDLLPFITPMVGQDGVATGMRNRLILRAAPDRMREIEQTIEQLDTVRVNRRITVNSSQDSQAAQRRVDANGQVKIGDVTVSNRRIYRRAPNGVDIILEDSHTQTQQNSSQFLNVLDGERAFIKVGQLIPFTQEWLTITKRYVHVERVVDWYSVSTGFTVRPRTIGDQVHLEITPRIARRNSHEFIDFETLSTTLRVPLGQWVDIAGTMQHRDDVSRKILGAQNSGGNQHSHLSVRVD